jgi:hypothetical protein
MISRRFGPTKRHNSDWDCIKDISNTITMQLRGCEFIRISAIEIAAPKVLKLEVPFNTIKLSMLKKFGAGTLVPFYGTEVPTP